MIDNPELFLQGFQDLDDRGSTRLDVQMVEGSSDDDVRPGRPGDGRKRKPERKAPELNPHLASISTSSERGQSFGRPRRQKAKFLAPVS